LKINGISSASPTVLPAAERREAERSEDSRSGGAGKTVAPEPPGPTRPDPEVVPTAKRRAFTADYKLAILAEAMLPRPTPAPSEPCCAVKASIPPTWSLGGVSGKPA